jgi:uncharacterized membrane protein
LRCSSRRDLAKAAAALITQQSTTSVRDYLEGVGRGLKIEKMPLPVLAMLVVMIFELVVVVFASVAAYRGQYFRCPLNIPFIPRPPIPFDTDDHADLD